MIPCCLTLLWKEKHPLIVKTLNDNQQEKTNPEVLSLNQVLVDYPALITLFTWHRQVYSSVSHLLNRKAPSSSKRTFMRTSTCLRLWGTQIDTTVMWDILRCETQSSTPQGTKWSLKVSGTGIEVAISPIFSSPLNLFVVSNAKVMHESGKKLHKACVGCFLGVHA